jgi:hypothetical protein
VDATRRATREEIETSAWARSEALNALDLQSLQPILRFCQKAEKRDRGFEEQSGPNGGLPIPSSLPLAGLDREKILAVGRWRQCPQTLELEQPQKGPARGFGRLQIHSPR